MDAFAEMKRQVEAAIARLVAEGRLPPGLDLGAVTVEPPRDPAHGDMASNAAMVLARPARIAPRDLAAALAEILRQAPLGHQPRNRGLDLPRHLRECIHRRSGLRALAPAVSTASRPASTLKSAPFRWHGARAAPRLPPCSASPYSPP
jgi:hypothetical protein